MSTNFYIKGYNEKYILVNGEMVAEDRTMDLNWHIGKQYGIGGGKLGFTWAMHHVKLGKRLTEEGFEDDDSICIVNELGEEYTLEEFFRVIESCELQTDKHINKEWC